ncbi:hypothetical protein NHX12_020281 [Muraenolepis orangiensis]|uniref:Uncharacterized protein n=1 Tax=Muraenolepis orangiensis TaxID=630683 RepID=A0A9Q0EWY7_9TELE|nr:hypothetical protein NHX12_020281 [Muraenolepis orangiensis]
MEKDFQSAPKRFWQTIRRLRRGKRGSIQAVYSKGGTFLTSTEEVIGRWKEHFEELLNPTTPSMWSEIRDGRTSLPSAGEMMERYGCLLIDNSINVFSKGQPRRRRRC